MDLYYTLQRTYISNVKAYNMIKVLTVAVSGGALTGGVVVSVSGGGALTDGVVLLSLLPTGGVGHDGLEELVLCEDASFLYSGV